MNIKVMLAKAAFFFYCAFNIPLKEVFRLAFYSKWKTWISDFILSGTICLYCFSALFSNIYGKINFMAKNWSDPCSFYCKLDFWKFFIRKHFFAFLYRF